MNASSTPVAKAAIADPLDDLVRIALDQHVVLEGRGLALVAVHDEVGRRGLPPHRPLAARREAGPAASEQARLVDLGSDVRRCHRQCLAEALVAAGGEVTVEREGILQLDARGDDTRRFGDHARTGPVCGPGAEPDADLAA